MELSLKPRTTALLLALATAIAVAPLVLPIQGRFTGTDDVASGVIEEARPGYQRWILPFWEPPSKEIESLIFALQAAAGAGVFGYVLGRLHGARRRDDADR